MESRKCQSHNFCLTVLSLWVLMNRSWKCRNAEFQYKITWQTWVQNAYTFIVGWVFLTLILELVLTNLMWRAIFPQEQGEVLYKSGRSGDISRTNTVWGLFRRRRWRKCISIIDGGSGYSLKMSLWRGVDGDSQFPYQERWGIGGNDWKLGGPLHTQR